MESNWFTGIAFDERAVRERVAAAYDRAFHPEGTTRHWAAVVSQPDRTSDLARVIVPTLVIHGEDDPLVDVSGGIATARAIPGAILKTIPGWDTIYRAHCATNSFRTWLIISRKGNEGSRPTVSVLALRHQWFSR